MAAGGREAWVSLLRFVAGDGANAQATFIQAIGLVIFASLLSLLARSVARDWFTDFAKGFVYIAAAVISLRVGFALGPVFGRPFFATYFLAEYLFLFHLMRGAAGLSGRRIRRSGLPLLPLALGAAVVLAYTPGFSAAFVVQAGLLAAGFFTTLAFAMKARPEGQSAIGVRLLRTALLVLGIGFAQYVPVVGAAVARGEHLPPAYANFMPVFDLLFETFLACAIVVTGMESVQQRLSDSNRGLEEARDRLAALARTDPLTDLLNRHAFAAVLESDAARSTAGSLAVVDLDGLKAVNDTYGHVAGDLAIRAYARALRDRLRADDLIFRWGGDEFLAILFGLEPEETARRFESLGGVDVPIESGGACVTVRVRGSVGIAAFAGLAELKSAAEEADRRMYEAKRGRARESESAG